ncbi:MAG: hypothetical protein AAF577_14755 [Pseudomonadota bacterium]
MNKHIPHTPDLQDAVNRAARGRTIEVDVQKYQAYLDDPALSPAQKEQIIEALWSIMVHFVELGFGVHPVQQACGQLGKTCDAADAASPDMLRSEDIETTHHFEDAKTEQPPGTAPERQDT